MSRVIIRQLEQSDLHLCSLHRLIMSASRRSCGSSLGSQQQTKSSWNFVCNTGNPCFHSSGGILSTPTTLPLFSYCVALIVSAMVGNSSSSAFNGDKECKEVNIPGQYG